MVPLPFSDRMILGSFALAAKIEKILKIWHTRVCGIYEICWENFISYFLYVLEESSSARSRRIATMVGGSGEYVVQSVQKREKVITFDSKCKTSLSVSCLSLMKISLFFFDLLYASWSSSLSSSLTLFTSIIRK